MPHRPTLPVVLGCIAAAGVLTAAAAGSAAPRGTAAVADCSVPTLNALVNPPDSFSHGGVLKLRLAMQPGTAPSDSGPVTSNLYNGLYAPPTLRMSPGDSVDMWVVNGMQANSAQAASQIDSTNHHYHGFVATPQPYRAVFSGDTSSGDNVTNRHIAAGDSIRYGLRIPSDHAQGTFWYHPHPHGNTDPQVSGGLAGAIVVGQIQKLFPEYTVVAERVMLIKDLNQNGDYSINGVRCPVIQVVQGQQQLWHVLNATAEDFLNVKLQNLSFMVLAYDGNPVPTPVAADSLLLPPGSRADVIVIGGTPGFRKLYSDSTSNPDNFTGPTLGWVFTGPALPLPIPVGTPTVNQALIDSMTKLRTAAVAQHRTWRYDVHDNGNVYSFNDTVYSPTRLDYTIAVGEVQEDTLINETNEFHSFHLHQTDMLVTSINGNAPATLVYRDNIFVGTHTIPATVGGTQVVGDTVVIRFKFVPLAVGPFVFHCHQLFHEDSGMMRNVCVYDPNDPKSKSACGTFFPGGSVGAHAGH